MRQHASGFPWALSGSEDAMAAVELAGTRHAVRDYCLAPSRPIDAPLGGAEGRYARMFDLPALYCEPDALLELGVKGGACDFDAIAALVDAPMPDANVAAGWPVFGQFIAHDITADRSPLTTRTDPDRLVNYRSPRANLESV